MNKVTFPELESIALNGFSLYKKQPTFEYKFIKGVNLIIGGNGVGKTTFVNIIKYALIGLYKKDYDFTRTYKEKKIERREQISERFFANRMDPTYSDNKNSYVTLIFKIGEIVFTVKRGLYDITLLEVKTFDSRLKVLSEKLIPGRVISQNKYERLSDDEKKSCLQFNYENLVASACGLNSFDDLIFFTNEILFFGEDHKTVLWNDDYEQIQLRLTGNFFNDPEINDQRKNALGDERYYDSLSRHKSEDMRVLKDIIKKLSNEGDKNSDVAKAVVEIEKVKSEIARLGNALDEVHNRRTSLLDSVGSTNKSISEVDFKKQAIESAIKANQAKISESLFVKINPKYNTYVNNIQRNHVCPMCSQELSEYLNSWTEKHTSACFVCHLPLPDNSDEPKVREELRNELQVFLEKTSALQLQIVQLEEQVSSLDKEYQKINNEVFNEKNKLRKLEHLLNKDRSAVAISDIDVIRAELKKLEDEKDAYALKSREMKKKAERYGNILEEENIKINLELSSYFSQYASNFLGLESSLAFEKYGSTRKFIPVIDGKERLSSEELSESQRFFVDHSFRMSILSLFYTSPGFFICETPDSSLDISYEHKAAEVFLTYLKNPNVLILTSNLNNSEFLEYMIDYSDSISVLNLFDYGKMSPVQQESTILRKAIDKIHSKIKSKKP